SRRRLWPFSFLCSFLLPPEASNATASLSPALFVDRRGGDGEEGREEEELDAAQRSWCARTPRPRSHRRRDRMNAKMCSTRASSRSRRVHGNVFIAGYNYVKLKPSTPPPPSTTSRSRSYFASPPPTPCTGGRRRAEPRPLRRACTASPRHGVAMNLHNPLDSSYDSEYYFNYFGYDYSGWTSTTSTTTVNKVSCQLPLM
ncbi:unnamed protein product, partial [Urochloa humidicola]